MFGLKRRQVDKRLCCPVCGRPPVTDWTIIDLHEPDDGWQRRVWAYKCPCNHMATAYYDDAGTAWRAWLTLIGLTETRLKEHEQ